MQYTLENTITLGAVALVLVLATAFAVLGSYRKTAIATGIFALLFTFVTAGSYKEHELLEALQHVDTVVIDESKDDEIRSGVQETVVLNGQRRLRIDRIKGGTLYLKPVPAKPGVWNDTGIEGYNAPH